MNKNIVIFSDGTGQAGGFRFDENRSNIYKLYRATRCGPDSSVDPREQVTFYDAGLGSQADGGHLAGRIFRWIHNVVAQATGFGITKNIIDCYAALIRLWEPGDRIFLFGFSRGAYTVRCLAGVVAKCGIPRHPARRPNDSLRLDEGSTQKLAAYAVKHIYQFTYPRKLQNATKRQQFQMQVRDELASQFRQDHGSADPDDGTRANVYPHFIGVFDTVAALGNPVTTALFTLAFLVFAAGLGVLGWLLHFLGDTSPFGSLLARLNFTNVFLSVIAIALVSAIFVYCFTHFKWAHEFWRRDWKTSLRSIHFNELWMTFYDYDLNPNVGYARHALSIDENRKNFHRVPWHSVKATARDAYGLQWFEQVWFSGNHSDIGGSYPENESRLSDSALDWMLKWATVVPGGLKYDDRVLKLSPYPEGMQHDELQAGLGLVTKLTGYSWTEEKRKLPSADAVMHRSVYKRFDLPAVQIYDTLRPYRPQTLATHKDFEPYYRPGAQFPAKSNESGTEAAEEPPRVTPLGK